MHCGSARPPPQRGPYLEFETTETSRAPLAPVAPPPSRPTADRPYRRIENSASAQPRGRSKSQRGRRQGKPREQPRMDTNEHEFSLILQEQTKLTKRRRLRS